MRIIDWSKVDWSNAEHRAMVIGAVNHFAQIPERYPAVLREGVKRAYNPAHVNHFSPDDFPTSVVPLIEKYHAVTAYDMGYTEIFDIRDFTNTPRNSFDISDVEDTLAFIEVKPGGQARLGKMAGTKTNVPFVLYGGGLQWFRTLIEDQEYWTLEDNAISFLNKAGTFKAQVHYDLIDAVGSGQNITWQTSADATSGNDMYLAKRDIATINAAITNIIENVKDKGYGVTMGTEFLILAPHQLMTRIDTAVKVLDQPVSGSSNRLRYRVRPMYTTMLSSSTSYYVILPKNKLKGGNRKNLTIESESSALTYSDLAVGWQRFGAAIGDSEQVQRCATS